MPCSDGRVDDCSEERRWLQAATRAACEALNVLESHNLIGELPGFAERWWTAHKAADAARMKREREELDRLRMRTEAIKKLTPEEKAALGIRD